MSPIILTSKGNYYSVLSTPGGLICHCWQIVLSVFHELLLCSGCILLAKSLSEHVREHFFWKQSGLLLTLWISTLYLLASLWTASPIDCFMSFDSIRTLDCYECVILNSLTTALLCRVWMKIWSGKFFSQFFMMKATKINCWWKIPAIQYIHRHAW